MIGMISAGCGQPDGGALGAGPHAVASGVAELDGELDGTLIDDPPGDMQAARSRATVGSNRPRLWAAAERDRMSHVTIPAGGGSRRHAYNWDVPRPHLAPV
jgi:hypothetical protein